PVFRSDGSGTNFLFSYYLSAVSPSFKSKIGANTSVEWPSGIGAKGNEGVANMSTQTAGAIGYVEYAYAKQNKMAYVLMKNRSGKAVEPNAKSFQAAAANADWAKAEGYFLILTDQAGADSWPITGASFILMPTVPADPAAARTALEFFEWAYTKGGDLAAQLDYVPLPASVTKLVEKTWQTSILSAGKPVWSPKH
ncbi:MAG TPA: substrate-binding domain-containing protein, partial [Steroidobacteraceae bacterium]|nr:substrate-binding domain-containing protein [Steroidobacteraceae bacterium]